MVYGLSTEGYKIANQLSLRGYDVSIIDESTNVSILLSNEISRTYTSISSLFEDEQLLSSNQSVEESIADSNYLFFSPKIRKVGNDNRIEINSKFIDAIKSLKKKASVVYTLPVGIGGNTENISLLERSTGFNVGEDLFYYYMPISPISIYNSNILVGSYKSRSDDYLIKLIKHTEFSNPNFMDLVSAEISYISLILRHYSGIASILEMSKLVNSNNYEHKLVDSFSSDMYFDDFASGLFDLRIIQSSLSGTSPLVYLVNGTVKSIEGYVKILIDKIRLTLKRYDLKASKTKVSIGWTLDINEIRGDKLDLSLLLETKLRDYLGDVDRYESNSTVTYNQEKTHILISCSKNDYKIMSSNFNKSSDLLLLKANSTCELSSKKTELYDNNNNS